jgi:hypothetical protein
VGVGVGVGVGGTRMVMMAGRERGDRAMCSRRCSRGRAAELTTTTHFIVFYRKPYVAGEMGGGRETDYCYCYCTFLYYFFLFLLLYLYYSEYL